MGAPLELMRERLGDNLQRTPRSVGRHVPSTGGSGLHHPALKRVIDQATEEARRLKTNTSRPNICCGHCLGAKQLLRKSPARSTLNHDMIAAGIEKATGGQKASSPTAESRYRTLEKYARIVTQLRERERLDP